MTVHYQHTIPPIILSATSCIIITPPLDPTHKPNIEYICIKIPIPPPSHTSTQHIPIYHLQYTNIKSHNHLNYRFTTHPKDVDQLLTHSLTHSFYPSISVYIVSSSSR